VGLTTSTTIRRRKAIASRQADEIYTLVADSTTPSRSPPTIAPTICSMPPRTEAAKALVMLAEPMVG
jgi:hypothetical protein